MDIDMSMCGIDMPRELINWPQGCRRVTRRGHLVPGNEFEMTSTRILVAAHNPLWFTAFRQRGKETEWRPLSWLPLESEHSAAVVSKLTPNKLRSALHFEHQSINAKYDWIFTIHLYFQKRER